MLIIGEKINSSRANIAEMVKKRNKEYFKILAREQVENGAQMLDINVGTFRKDETDHMKWLIHTVQEAVEVPLCIDSSNYLVINEGLNAYNWNIGKPLINSVTCEKEKLDLILPLVKKYQCNVIALAMDKNGIPNEPLGRVKIIQELIKEFTTRDVPLDNIYLDPLVLPVGANIKNGNISLEVLKQIKELYPTIKTIMGLSNISFGLPTRKLINQSFCVLSMYLGLDAVILDSTDRTMMNLMRATKVLLGKDNYCLEYLNAYREGKLKE